MAKHLRIILYTGPQTWINSTLLRSIHGILDVSGGPEPRTITELASISIPEGDESKDKETN